MKDLGVRTDNRKYHTGIDVGKEVVCEICSKTVAFRDSTIIDVRRVCVECYNRIKENEWKK